MAGWSEEGTVGWLAGERQRDVWLAGRRREWPEAGEREGWLFHDEWVDSWMRVGG
jgi:hypothetical protein